jgi:signal transduction histidine kinase
MLSVFSNQAALAIENTRQREKLEIMEGVTWRGLQLADKNHSALNQLRPMQMVTNTLMEFPTNDDVLDQVEKLNRFIRDVEKTLTPVRPLQFRPTPTKIELNDLLRRVIPEWCPIDDQIETDFNYLKKDKIWITADRARLSAVMKILTQNAVKAMRSASSKRLTVSSATEKGLAVVTIKNTGVEIPQDIKSQLLKEPITKTSGSGMGLLIARGILLRTGGDIRLVKSDSTGTTFSFFLPLAMHKRRRTHEARHDQAKDSRNR